MPTHDVVIIGAGPAGFECAMTLRKEGVDCAIIERDAIGGVCTNWGCVPAKAMIASANLLDEVRRAAEFGLRSFGIEPDFPSIAERRDNIIHTERAHLQTQLEEAGVNMYFGDADIHSSDSILVKLGQRNHDGSMDYNGQIVDINYGQLVLACGSTEWVPPGVQLDGVNVITSGELVRLTTLPKELVIIGGGFIGVEIASMFASFGTKVTIIEFGKTILSFMDPELSIFMEQLLTQKGVIVKTSCKVDRVEDQQIYYTYHNGSSETIYAPKVLVSTGRRPNVPKHWVKMLDLKTDEKDRVITDDALQTSQEGVWVIGDASGRSALAHVGVVQGRIVGKNTAAVSKQDHPREMFDDTVIPAIVYSHPEMASVGEVPNNADHVLVKPWQENLRAQLETQRSGFVKLWIKDYMLIAAQIVGHNAGELIMQCSELVRNQTDVRSLKDVIAPHPSYSEMLWEMLREV